MTLFNRKPGESLVIKTPRGPIVIKMMYGEQIGVDVPSGLAVEARETKATGAESWLPARPDRKERRVA